MLILDVFDQFEILGFKLWFYVYTLYKLWFQFIV